MDVGRAGEHQLHVIGNHTERHRGIAVEPSLPVLCGGGNDGCAVGGRSAHVARVAGGDGDGEECGACECSVHIAPGRSELLRSEEHTSELQSRLHLVCRLLLEKKKKTKITRHTYDSNSTSRRRSR